MYYNSSHVVKLTEEKKMKQARYYEVEGETVYIYNEPFADKATSVSIVRIEDLKYYRKQFRLSKVWK